MQLAYKPFTLTITAALLTAAGAKRCERCQQLLRQTLDDL